MKIVIRSARPEDCPDLERLAAALNGAEGNPTDLFTREFALDICFGPNASLNALVAEAELADGQHRVVGMALFHDSINTGFGQIGSYLNDLYVEAKWRRLGIARALMANVAAVSRARGRTFIWWTVKPKNTDGMAFYRSMGAGQEAVLAHAVGFTNFDALADSIILNPAADH